MTSFIKMSFYVTLPSDSSMNYFPENKISNFITKLPSPIVLTGSWEMALVEFMYPHTWYNVNAENNLIGFDLNDGKKLGRRIPPGYYETVPDILNAIKIKEHDNKIYFHFNNATKRVSITVQNGAKVFLEDGLAQLLGFEPTEIISTPESNISIKVESSYVADPCAHYRVLMIYTDIVESQVVGDVVAPLLRIVTVTGKDGEMVNVQYERPHYLPVIRKVIDTIEINIRNHRGKLTPFERGRSYVKLHFRQKHLA